MPAVVEFLDRIKQVEADVASDVESHRRISEKAAARFREECARKVQAAVSQAVKKSERSLKKAEADAESEASLIIAGAGKEAALLKKTSDKNVAKAVGFVVSKLGG